MSRRCSCAKDKEAVSLDESIDALEVVDIHQRTRTPDEAAVNTEFREMFMSAMMALPADDRLVLTLQYMEGMTYQEIAAFLEMPQTTVVGMVQRARQRLRKELEKLAKRGLSRYRPGREFTEDVLDQISMLASGDFVLEKTKDRLIWRMCRASGSLHFTPVPMYLVLHYLNQPEILLQSPITISDVWLGEVTQGARKGWGGVTTVISNSEQVECATGKFSDCLLLKTEINGQGVFADMHRDSSVGDSDFGRSVPDEVNDFVCGIRQMWFAKDVGIVKLRYEHRDGTVTSIQLTDFLPVKRTASSFKKDAKDNYFPLSVGNTWRYEWKNSTVDFTIKETLTIASQRENRYTFHCFGYD